MSRETRIVNRDRWICGPAPDSTARVRLFCFPYAGGGANAFRPWRSLLSPAGVDACCVQFPGRETRFSETPITGMHELARQTCDGIESYFDLPFSFFGHSMGALVCFEVTAEFARRGHKLPEWLLMSGAIPPHQRDVESLHTLPTPEFIAAVARRYNGLLRAVLADQDLLDVVTPILRADIELTERYRFETAKALPVKIAAFGGRWDESVPPVKLQYWRDLTAQPERFQAMLFDGDHFFLNDHRQQLLTEIVRILT
jgi:medium-chain acyl-[acyl-carrier-protein] hydrolase